MKKGDIVICSKPEDFNFRTSQLVVGDKYQIISDPFIMYATTTTYTFTPTIDEFIIDVKNVETGKIHTFVTSVNFITLEELRDFRLREILDNGN